MPAAALARCLPKVGATAEALTDLWLTLWIADLQIRRVTGTLPPLAPEAITRRADRALDMLCRLYAAPRSPYV